MWIPIWTIQSAPRKNAPDGKPPYLHYGKKVTYDANHKKWRWKTLCGINTGLNGPRENMQGRKCIVCQNIVEELGMEVDEWDAS